MISGVDRNQPWERKKRLCRAYGSAGRVRLLDHAPAWRPTAFAALTGDEQDSDPRIDVIAR